MSDVDPVRCTECRSWSRLGGNGLCPSCYLKNYMDPPSDVCGHGRDPNYEPCEECREEEQPAAGSRTEERSVLELVESILGGFDAGQLFHQAAHLASQARIRALEEALKDAHTQECLDYAAKTGRAFCIVSCADRRRALLGEAKS